MIIQIQSCVGKMKIGPLFDMVNTIFDIHGKKLLLIGYSSTAKDEHGKIVITLKFVLIESLFMLKFYAILYPDDKYEFNDLKRFADDSIDFPFEINPKK